MTAAEQIENTRAAAPHPHEFKDGDGPCVRCGRVPMGINDPEWECEHSPDGCHSDYWFDGFPCGYCGKHGCEVAP